MVSPQERHTMVGPLSGSKGERSMVEGVSCAMCVSTETGGSATGLSVTNAWHGAAVSDDEYVRLMSAVARLSFRQKARNLDSTNGAIAKNLQAAIGSLRQVHRPPSTVTLPPILMHASVPGIFLKPAP